MEAVRLPLLFPIALLLAGCATPKGAAYRTGQPYVVSANHCDFYSFGPAQAGGPDFSLSRGQQLTMLSYEYGYSKVSIAGTGQTGWLPTERISPAPHPARPGPTPAARRRRLFSAGPYTQPTGPQRVPLPAYPETQPPPGSPPFRY
ncbi:MAG TPA: hypothetical protein VHY22_12050 [Chthoniobacteraceae bacterium]|jgi:hypothetical protein|nr:hypothetical protein [Chthoniobacteraceae bacterium]